jgi:hypothetical protein
MALERWEGGTHCSPTCLWVGALAEEKNILPDLGTSAPGRNPGRSERLTFLVLAA